MTYTDKEVNTALELAKQERAAILRKLNRAENNVTVWNEALYLKDIHIRDLESRMGG